MSSEISTERVRPSALRQSQGGLEPGRQTAGSGPPERDDSLQPWQLFVLAALACATALTFMTRGQGVTAVVLYTLLMGAAALVGMAALRAIRPLVSSYED